MSKILLNKINNILDIDKTREYIDLTNFIDDDNFINLDFAPREKIDDFIKDKSSSINFTFNINYQEILDQVKKIDNQDELVEFISKYDLENFKIENFLTIPKQIESNKNPKKKIKEIVEIEEADNEQLIKENFLYSKRKIYDYINKSLLTSVERFEKINKRSKKTFIETGKELLRIGFDFIRGHINDVYINAPLFFFDIEINIEQNKVNVIKKSKQIINEKLLIFMLKELNIDYKTWDFEQIKSKEIFIELFEPILQYKIELEDLVFENRNNLHRTIKCIDDVYIGLFDVKPGKIKDDFIEIINSETKLLNEKMKNDFEFYTKEEFNDKALIQINNPLNIYQKYAIRSAINENTLIYGPPGTGKSEIITSIIANLLIKEKNILVVSEKDAALDVIKRRLGKLNIFAFYLKDIENEFLFYEQIESISSYMGSFYNDYYKTEEFDLTDSYQVNDRIMDYNEVIENFRKIIQEDINFSLEKDSRNNDYRDYLLSIREVETFVKNNKTGINDFWKEYENKFVKLQSPTEFISKVAEFNWFREKYELSEEEAKQFDLTRNDLNKFLVENDLINYKIESFDLLKSKVENLISFIEDQLLHKDKDFMSNLENDYYFLSKNHNLWNRINDLLIDVKEKEYIKKILIRYSARHEKFLSKYINVSKNLRNNLLQRYFYKGEISTSKILFKPKLSQKTLDAFFESIQLFEKIKLFKNNIYLNELIERDVEIFNPIIIYFYNHQNLLKKPFVEFYNQQIINFDQRIIHQYYKYRVNQIERELININVYNFEKLSKNKHIIDKDIPYLITRYLKDNQDFILNIDEALKQTYLKHLKNVLAKSSKEIQEKMEKMFKVTRMDLKPKINDFISEFLDCLRIIFPIWISKPELISFYLPNERNIFDFGIFDEASQMFLEKAYPMIYRCNQLIIAGDDKQLKPERILFNEFENDPDYRPLVKEVEFDYSESLLDRARVSYWNTYTLRNHYRSQSKELIEFSNLNFYEDKLLFTSINNVDINPLEIYTNNKSKEDQSINKEEAKLVLAKLKKEMENFSKTLIICFTPRQKEYLINLIKKESHSDLLIRMKKNLLVIGDISSVQGDEGDLVIISCVFSKDSKDYGLLEKPRGANYLNVAITRAKSKLIVFKSINAKEVEIKLDNPYPDLQIFKKWISYLDTKEKELSKSRNLKMMNNTSLSNFKKEVLDALKNNEKFEEFEIVSNLIIGSINIDIAIFTKSSNKIKLIIILDDWKKNITIQDWFEDIDQEEYLKSRNYHLMRIREQEWLKKQEIIIEKINNELLKINENSNVDKKTNWNRRVNENKK